MAFNPRIDKEKDYKFFIELYPDAENYIYDDILHNCIECAVEYAYITHNNDVNTDTGELKKPHTHFYLKTSSKRSIKALAEDIKLPSNYIQYALSTKYCIRYLVHIDQPDKTQYNIDDVISNFDFVNYILDSKNCELLDMKKIFEFITNHSHCSFTDVTAFALENNVYTTLRKSSYLVKQLLDENRKIS